MDRKFLCLTVYPTPDGRLLFDRPREVRRPPVDDGWWSATLHDYRARVPHDRTLPADDPHVSQYRLDRQRGSFTVKCGCASGKMMSFDTDKMLAEGHDPAINTAWIAKRCLPCHRRVKYSNTCRAIVVR